MGFIAQDTGGGDFKRTPAGVHIGRCYAVIDIGTQEVAYEGDKKLQRKALIKWELFGEDDQGAPLVVTVEGKEMPMTITKKYTLSLSDKARLRGDLQAWRGKDFTQEELKGFDVSKLVGAYCMVNVTHNETSGKTFANVASITPLPAALKAAKPAGVHKNILFDVDQPDMDVFNSFHERLQDQIKASVEWQSRGKRPTAKTAFDDMPSETFEEADIPF